MFPLIYVLAVPDPDSKYSGVVPCASAFDPKDEFPDITVFKIVGLVPPAGSTAIDDIPQLVILLSAISALNINVLGCPSSETDMQKSMEFPPLLAIFPWKVIFTPVPLM